jgi:hypothetical protein
MPPPNPELIEEIVRCVTNAVHPLRVILFGSAARSCGRRPAYLLCMGSQISRSERTGDRIL